MGSKKQRTLSWPFGDFKERNSYFDFIASQLWGQAVQLSESSLFGSTRKYWQQAGCEFSLTPALMAEALRSNHGVCGWSEPGELPVPQGRVGCCPSKVGHIAGVLHFSPLWKLSGCFHQKITFHQKIAFHQKVPAWAIPLSFVGEACFWECCSFAGIVLKEGFFILQWQERANDPAASAPGASTHWDGDRCKLPPHSHRSKSWVSLQPSKCSKCWAAE